MWLLNLNVSETQNALPAARPPSLRVGEGKPPDHASLPRSDELSCWRGQDLAFPDVRRLDSHRHEVNTWNQMSLYFRVLLTSAVAAAEPASSLPAGKWLDRSIERISACGVPTNQAPTPSSRKLPHSVGCFAAIGRRRPTMWLSVG